MQEHDSIPVVKINPEGIAFGIDDSNQELLREVSWRSNSCEVFNQEVRQNTFIRYIGGRWIESFVNY